MHKAGVPISLLGHCGLERYRIRDSKLASWSIRIGETVTPIILNLGPTSTRPRPIEIR